MTQSTEQERAEFTDGAWYWVEKEGWHDEPPKIAPAMYRADCDAWYSWEFSGISTEYLKVLEPCVRHEQAARCAPVVPQLSQVAQKKLDYLLEAGEVITGYAIQNKDGRRGAIDCHGFVYWWQDSKPVVPQGWKITEEMHVAAVKVLHRASGVDGLPQRMVAAMLAAAPQPPEAAQLDDTNVADMAQAVDSKEAAPVQMPEPVAVAFRFETEENGPTETSFYPSDRIGMGWNALYTEQQVRQLLAAHGIEVAP